MTGGLGSNVGSACQLTMVLVVQGAQLWFGALVRGALGLWCVVPSHLVLKDCWAVTAAPRALSAVDLSVLPILLSANEAHTFLSEMKTRKPQSPGPKPCQPLPLLSYSSQ